MAIATTDVQGVGAGVMVGFLAAPGLFPLVSWTVTIAILLTWVWWMSWPQDSEGTKRLAEQESTMSMDVWLLAAALASLAVVAVSETEPTTTVMRRVVLGHAL